MSDGQTELLQGTLALLILKALLNGRPAHGYGIARWIEATTDDALRIEEGSLYPALRRIEDRGWVTSEWGRRSGEPAVGRRPQAASGSSHGRLHARHTAYGLRPTAL